MSLRLTITPTQLARLRDELRRATRREIGGVLVGEHLGADEFRLVGMSFQRRGGGPAHFRRDPVAGARFVDKAIAEAGGDATSVNYLGEWHSHPSMSASPSSTDVAQMQAIVNDSAEVATFAVLIVGSWQSTGLELSATLFRASVAPEPVEVRIMGTDGWTQATSEPHDEEAEPVKTDARRATDEPP